MKLSEVAPSKLILQTILVRGGAFLADYEFDGKGVKSRYFVVANHNPANDETIILFTATTQIDKRRAHRKDRADVILVPLDPVTYDGVKAPCVLDCESAIRRKRADFVKHVEERKYMPLTTLPEIIMARVVAAVREARTLSPAEKRLILGEPKPIVNI